MPLSRARHGRLPKPFVVGVSLLVLVLVVSMASVFLVREATVAYGTGRVAAPTDVPEDARITSSIPAEDAIELEWYGEHLETEAERDLYQTMKAALLGVREGVVVDHMDAADVERVFWAVVYDHPEIFWVDKKYTFYYEDGDTEKPVVAFDFHYYIDDFDEIQQKMRDYELMADTIIASDMRGGRNGRARAAYLWVGGATVYVEGDLDQSMMSVFDDHESVCAGYTQALQFVWLRAGIPCVRISGHCLEEDGSPKDSNHTWLVAQVNGSSLHYDVTWDDAENPSAMSRYYGLMPAEMWEMRVPATETFPLEWFEYIDPREMTESAIVIESGEHMEYHEPATLAGLFSSINLGGLDGVSDKLSDLLGRDPGVESGPPDAAAQGISEGLAVKIVKNFEEMPKI